MSQSSDNKSQRCGRSNTWPLCQFDPTSPTTKYNPKIQICSANYIYPYSAWLSVESTIEEINVNQQFFILSGCMTVFWKDDNFDKDGKLKEIARNNVKCPRETLELILKIIKPPKVDEEQKSNNKDLRQNEEQKNSNSDNIINLNHLMSVMINNYPLPFVQSLAEDGQLVLFKNALEFKFTGYKPIDLDYNIEHHVFKLQIQFKTKLYECFENNNNEFPFEWQFLNAQIPYRKDKYNFVSERPKFVENAFSDDPAFKIWAHAALVRKLDNVDEWKLLRPWVDLRKKDDYEQEFEFGLIKYRVRRNPHYYMLEVIIPLYLMVMCAFCVLLPAWDVTSISERLSYVVTLLLAVAAFQISVVGDMPYKSQFTLVDGYFLLAYFLLAALVIEQSIEMSVDDDGDWTLTLYVGLVIFALWMFHSLRFVLKWLTHSDLIINFKWVHLYHVLDNCAFVGILSCIHQLFICCVVKLNCCKKKKRKGRLEIWMEMEKKEASTWDTTNKIKNLSEKAEMVLATDASYINTYEEFGNDRRDLVQSFRKKDSKCCGIASCLRSNSDYQGNYTNLVALVAEDSNKYGSIK